MPPGTIAFEAMSSTETSSSSSSPIQSPLDEPIPEYKHVTSLPWILHHILECELSSELPLRIMFSFNAGRRLPTLQEAHKWWRNEPRGKLIIDFISSLPKITPSINDTSIDKLQNPTFGPTGPINTNNGPQDRFMDASNEALLDLNFLAQSSTQDQRQSQGIPRELIRTFCLTNVFNLNYNKVDFKQALTAIDYLRDLEGTRRTALREAAQRLGIKKDNWREVLEKDPAAKQWVEDVQMDELAIEEYYASIFIDLRIWTMINELQIEPFSRPNVLAMLNTIFPPSVRELPNDRISIKVLHKYRHTFYQYISTVEANDHSVVDSFIVRRGQPGSKHSWVCTHQSLKKYLDLADSMIEQASVVTGMESFIGNSSLLSHSRDASTTSSSFSRRLLTGSSANSSFDDLASVSSTPWTPNFPADSSSVRSRIYTRRKLSAPSGAQDFFESLGTSTVIRTTDCSETSMSTIRDLNRADTNASTSPLLECLDSNACSKARARSIPNAATPSDFLDEYHRFISASTLGPPVAGSGHRHSISLGRCSTSQDSRSPLASTPESRAETLTPTPMLPSKNLEFLSRPYDPHPSPKKQRSLGSLFLRKKSSTTTLATVSDHSSENKSNKKGLGISIAATKSSKKLPSLKLSPSGFAVEFPPYFNDAAGFERLLPRKSSSAMDNRNPPGSNRDRGGSRATNATPRTSGIEGRHRKGFSPFITSKQPSVSEATFVETDNECERFVVQYPNQLLTTTLKKQYRTPTLTSQFRNKLRKAPPASRPQAPSTVITSTHIDEPFPFQLQNKGTQLDLPAIKPAKAKLFEASEEFQGREYSRAWLLEASRAEKYGLQTPEGRPVMEDELINKKREGGKGVEGLLKFGEISEAEAELEIPKKKPKKKGKGKKEKNADEEIEEVDECQLSYLLPQVPTGGLFWDFTAIPLKDQEEKGRVVIEDPPEVMEAPYEPEEPIPEPEPVVENDGAGKGRSVVEASDTKTEDAEVNNPWSLNRGKPTKENSGFSSGALDEEDLITELVPAVSKYALGPFLSLQSKRDKGELHKTPISVDSPLSGKPSVEMLGVLGAREAEEATSAVLPEGIQPEITTHRTQPPAGQTVVLTILHKSKISNQTLQTMVNLAENTKEAILDAVSSYLNSNSLLVHFPGQRKIEIKYGAGKNGDLDLSALEESKWPEYLEYLRQYTRLPELTVDVLDIYE